MDNFKTTPKTWTPFLRQAFVTAGVSINVLGQGCVIAFSAILIPNLRLPESHIHATHAQESWIASVVGFALIVGNIISTFIIDAIGRKKSHIITTIPILFGWYTLVFAGSVFHIILARFLQGLSMGMHGAIGSIIIGEMTEPKNRGVLLTSISLALSTGVLFTHTIGIFISWQYTAFICSFITFTSLIIILYSPESPSWLISKGRLSEGRKVFYWLRGETPEQTEELEIMIRAQMAIKKASNAGMSIPFTARVKRNVKFLRTTAVKPEFYKPIIIVAHLYTLFQFSGTNVLSSYMTDIITQLVGEGVNVKFWMIALGIERLIASLCAIYLMKTLKRRTLLFISCSFCLLTYMLKALYIFLKQNSLLPFEGQWLPIFLIALYLFSITIGITVIPFAVGGELFPLEFRGLCGGISVLALSFNFFLAVKCFPVLTYSIGISLTYIVYAAIVGYCTIVLYFTLPETKGKTLQEIEDGFRGKQNNEDKKATEPLTGEVRYALEQTWGSQALC